MGDNRTVQISREEMNSVIKSNIRSLREANGLTRREVAGVLDIKENTYRIWEDKNKSAPKPYDIYRLAVLYNVTVDFILTKSTEKASSLSVSQENADADSVRFNYLNDLDHWEKLMIMKMRMLTVNEKNDLLDYLNKIVNK